MFTFTCQCLAPGQSPLLFVSCCPVPALHLPFSTGWTLFRHVAMEVGGALGYAYPQNSDVRVVAYVKDMQHANE